jgi:hypothetical protein
MLSISLTDANLAFDGTQLGEAEMKNRTETSSKGAPAADAANQPDYFELFRAFNSEGTFFDFARHLRTDMVQRWHENAPVASAG